MDNLVEKAKLDIVVGFCMTCWFSACLLKWPTRQRQLAVSRPLLKSKIGWAACVRHAVVPAPAHAAKRVAAWPASLLLLKICMQRKLHAEQAALSLSPC